MKLILSLFLIVISSLDLNRAKSLTKLTQPLPVTFPEEEIAKTERRVQQIEFRCPAKGLFANDLDCETFYECNEKGVKVSKLKCPENKLWNDKSKTCADPLESTCATLKVIQRTIPGEVTTISGDKKVLYRLITGKLPKDSPDSLGNGFQLVKRVKLLPAEEIEQHFQREKVPKELIEYYNTIKSKVSSYFLEIYVLNQEAKSQLRDLSIIELVNEYKRRGLTPFRLIDFYVKSGQIPKELIEYYRKHPIKAEEERVQLTRLSENEILEDIVNKKLMVEQLIEIYLRDGRLPEKLILWYQKQSPSQVTDAKEVTTEDQLINNYKKNELKPIDLIKFYITTHSIPKEVIVYYREHPPQFETEEQKTQSKRLSLKEILEDLKNNRLLTNQLIAFYLKVKGLIPQPIISWFQKYITKVTETKATTEPNILIDNYKKHELKAFQLIEYYISTKTIPEELILYYQQNPPKFESEEQKIQITRLDIDEILDDMKNNRLIPEQIIEFYLKNRQIDEKIIIWFQKHKTEITENVSTGKNIPLEPFEPNQLIQWYKENTLQPSQLIQYYVITHQIPQQLIVYYQQNPPQFESEEQRKQLTRLTIEEILEDIKNNRLLPAQLIEFYIRQHEIPKQIITLFEQDVKVEDKGMVSDGSKEDEKDERKPIDEKEGTTDEELVELYKINKLVPYQLIQYYITTQKLPKELIIYYQKHPPQFDSEEAKSQTIRLTIEEILEDLQKNKLHPAQLIEFYIRNGQIDQKIIQWFEQQRQKTVTPEDEVIDPVVNQLIELYKTNKLQPTQLIQYYVTKHKIPQELIVYYRNNPVQFDTEEQKVQLTRLSVEEILDDLKNNRLLSAQLIEFFIKEGKLADEILVWFKEQGQTTNGTEEKPVMTIDPEMLVEIYKKRELSSKQLIEYYISTKQIPRQLILYYQKHPLKFESEEHKLQLTRLSIEEILEDMKNNRLLPEQLIEFYLKNGIIDEQIINWFHKHKTEMTETKVTIDPTQLIQVYKKHQLKPTILFEYYISTKTIPRELILYYQKHPPQFNSEQKIQITRLSIEEILEDMKNNRLIPEQIIEFYLKNGQISEEIITWFKEHKIESTETKADPIESKLIEHYKQNSLKPSELIEYFISVHKIPNQLILYYQKHPKQFESEEQKKQLTRLSIEEIIDDLKSGKILISQLIEFCLKNGSIPEQVIVWYQKHRTTQVVKEDPTYSVTINKETLIDNYKNKVLKPTELIEYYITQRKIPQEFIIYYQSHPPKFETEDQKIQMTRLTIEEILEDLKGGRLLPSQLIEFYLKTGSIPQQIIVWYQKHKPTQVTEETTTPLKPEVLIEKYKEHKLEPSLIIQYYLTTQTIPEDLIVYYKKHPELVTDEDRKQITRISIEEVMDDLQRNRLNPSQLIEFYLKMGEIPQQIIIWYQKHKPTQVIEEDSNQMVTIKKEQLIDSYKNHVLRPSQLIEYYIIKHTIPQELIVYYQKHPPKLESEEQKIQLTRLSIEEILEDLKNGRLLPSQLIEFYLKQSRIPEQIVVWYQKHKPSHMEDEKTTIRSEILIELFKKGSLRPDQLIQYYIKTGQIPEDFLIYYREHPIQILTEEESSQLKRLTIEQILEDLRNHKLTLNQLIQFYIRQKGLPQEVLVMYEKIRPESVQTQEECKAYISGNNDELDLNQLCGTSCRSDTYTIPHPKSPKKYVVCNLGIKGSIKHVIRKCSHGLVFDSVYRTCEKQSVIDKCSVSLKVN